MAIAAQTSARGIGQATTTGAHTSVGVATAARGVLQAATRKAAGAAARTYSRGFATTGAQKAAAHVVGSARGSSVSASTPNKTSRVRTIGGSKAVAQTDATHYFRAQISPALSATGTLRTDNSAVYTPELDAVGPSGSRRTFCVVLYARDVLSPADAAAVPVDRHFLVSSAFVGGIGDPLFEIGATPNAIGKRVLVRGSESLIFRAPVPGEVALDVLAKSALRYETDPDTGAVSWKAYRTLPQRFLDGLGAVEVFDEAGILDFFALLVGIASAQWLHEANAIYRQRDPDAALEAYIPYLGLDYGIAINAADSEAAKRAAVRSAVPIAKLAGNARSLELRLLGRGYDATVHEVWINPGHPVARLVADVAGADRNVEIRYVPAPVLVDDTNANTILATGMSGGGDNVVAQGFVLFRDGNSPMDGDVLTLGDGTSSVSFEFDDQTVTTLSTFGFGASFSGTLGNSPVVPGSALFRFDSSYSSLVLCDNGAGALIVETAGGDFAEITVAYSSINYTSGAWSVTLSDPVTPGRFQTVHTSTTPVVSPGNTAVVIGPSAAATLGNFITAVNSSLLAITATDATAFNSQAGAFPDQRPGVSYPLEHTTSELGQGSDFITLPHGYRPVAPAPPYFLSSRLALYLAQLDGSPALGLSESDRGQVVAALASLLPAHVDVRLIGAKSNVNGPQGGERLALSEAFTITAV